MMTTEHSTGGERGPSDGSPAQEPWWNRFRAISAPPETESERAKRRMEESIQRSLERDKREALAESRAFQCRSPEFERDPEGLFASLMDGGMAPIEALKLMRTNGCDWSGTDKLRVMDAMMESDCYARSAHAKLALRNAFGRQYVSDIVCRGKMFWVASDSDIYH